MYLMVCTHVFFLRADVWYEEALVNFQTCLGIASELLSNQCKAIMVLPLVDIHTLYQAKPKTTSQKIRRLSK
jgi:hypothetical protein